MKTSTWVPPSEADLQAIRDLGHGATEPLSKTLDSPKPFKQILAVRLLEQIGGVEVLELLKRGLDPNRWVVVSMQSLSSLRSVPDEFARPIIRNAMNDKDDRVAKRAKDPFSTYYSPDVP